MDRVNILFGIHCPVMMTSGHVPAQVDIDCKRTESIYLRRVHCADPYSALCYGHGVILASLRFPFRLSGLGFLACLSVACVLDTFVFGHLP